MAIDIESVGMYGRNITVRYGSLTTEDIGEVKPRIARVSQFYVTVAALLPRSKPALVKKELQNNNLPGVELLNKMPMEPHEVSFKGVASQEENPDTAYYSWELGGINNNFGTSVRYKHKVREGLAAAHIGDIMTPVDSLLNNVQVTHCMGPEAVGFAAVLLAYIVVDLKKY